MRTWRAPRALLDQCLLHTISGHSRADYQRYRPNCVASAHGSKLTCQYPKVDVILDKRFYMLAKTSLL
jgi:hypothetical protein